MDRAITLANQRKSLATRCAKLVVLLAIFAGGVYGFNRWLHPEIRRENIRVAVVEIGDVEASFTASGIVVPAFEQIVSSPANSTIKAILKNVGETIEQGEQILELDTGFLEIEQSRLQDEYYLKQHKKRQLQLEIDAQSLQLLSQQDIKQLNIQFLENDFQKQERLQRLGIGTQSDFQQAELQLSIARREMRLLQEQAMNQKARLEADLHGLELELAIQQKRMSEVRQKVELAQTKSEYSGILTWINTQVGSSVGAGEAIAKVADLSHFQVEAEISEIYADRLHPGESVNVRINDTDLPGTIRRVRPAVENGVATFVVELENPQHALLKSNLRVDVFVVTSFARQVYRVKNGPFYRGGSSQKVFVVDENMAKAREATIGVTNLDYIEILEGLHPGDQVIISDMENYLHHDEIAIR